MEEQQHKEEFQQFKSWHDEAYLYINQAITQEKPEIDRPDVALIMYQKGLGVLDLALCVDTESKQDDNWLKARKMQQKMVKTRSHVESRIQIITESLISSNSEPKTHNDPCTTARMTLSSNPPSYEDVISRNNLKDIRKSSIPSRPPPPYTQHSITKNQNEEIIDLTGENNQVETGLASQMVRSETSDSVGSSEHGEVIFSMLGVQVFHISASGEVTTPSYPDTLHVVRFDRENDKNGQELPPAFIEVGEWTYPLIRGKSPVLKANYGGYIFPDLETSLTGGSVGIIIPETVSETDREIFESILTEITTAFKTQEEVETEYAKYKDFSNTLSSGLVKGAEVVGRGMVKGAVKTSEYLYYGSEYAKQYIVPEAAAREVDPKLRQGLEAARWVSTGACRVSGWMVSKVGSATLALGRLMAPHLERGANRALTNLTHQSNLEASNQIAIAGEIAGGAVAAVSTLYIALENSSKILAKNIANNTVMIVSHKYGADMAAATDAALSTAGNSYLAFYNAGALGPKSIAKRAVKDTAKLAIGVDQTEVDRRARVAPDSSEGLEDIIEKKSN